LSLTPDADLLKNSRPFITNSNLDLAGPVTATLRIRAKDAGQGKASITWRTKAESFSAHQTSEFAWPAGAEWQEVRVELPEKSRILHIRITPPKAASGIEIQSMEFKGSTGKPSNFSFETK
jgi:hypothetical protein